jgi:glycolate oxidase subunit GlcD
MTAGAQESQNDVVQPLPLELLKELAALLGDDAVIADPGTLLAYDSDGIMSYRVQPRAVMLPADTGEVAAVLRVLWREGIPFVARGSGTGLSGGALALEGAVVISTARMDRILSLDPANRRARVQPGVVNVNLSAAGAPHGLYYAPDPSSQSVCTIGGNVAENAGGPHCLKHGVTLNHILGAVVVLSDGSTVELGPRNGEDVGYDLLGLFVGSEGTFGIATEIDVRLSRVPRDVATLVALFERLDDASRCVSAVIAEGLLPAALEMVDHQAIMAVEASIYAAGMPTDIEALLIIEFDGIGPGTVADAERAEQVCSLHGAREVRRAANEKERQRMWHARKKAYGAMGRLAPDVLVQDAVVPRSKLPMVLRQIYGIAYHHGLKLCNMFHAGDGNLHPTILFDRRDEAQVRAVEQASGEMMRVCVEAGGTISGEHGVGMDKREFMDLIFSEDEMSLMCDVRRVFNPRGLANPAKVLPVRICREWIGPATRRADD